MQIHIDNLGRPDCWENAPEPKPELIKGLLREGDNLLLTAGSKAGKSNLLTELTICLAEGKAFLDVFQCQQSRVIYMNMEISSASMFQRFKETYSAMGITPSNRSNIDILNLKGVELDIIRFKNLLEQVIDCGYKAVIIDPVYTLIGDENSQAEMKALVGLINWVSASGVSVVYSHHHTKGSQSEKKAADRASGSSVLARATDAILDFVEIQIPEQATEQMTECGLCGDYTAWVMDCITREFEAPNSEIIAYRYPVHKKVTEYFEGCEIREKKQFGLFGSHKTEAKKKSLPERFDELFGQEKAIALSIAEQKLGISQKTLKLYLGDGVKAKNDLKAKYQLLRAGENEIIFRTA